MRVLVAMHFASSFGGLINHAEHLIRGFKAAGHDTHFCELVHRETVRDVSRKIKPSEREEWGVSFAGTSVHQLKGWDGHLRMPYKGEKAIREWKEFAQSFDLILWIMLVPTMRKDHIGNTNWLHIYNLEGKTKQLGIITDVHLTERCPHFMEVSQNFVGLICVHDSSFETAKPTGMRCSFQLNPFDLSMFPEKVPAYKDREKGFLSAHTWKGWKRIPELVAAIPHMPQKNFKKYVAGCGIDYNYMTTPDPKKMKSFCLDDYGRRIWDVALDYGMFYMGVITEEVRNKHMLKTRVFVDSSWSKSFSEHGGHLNRVAYESFLLGNILVARDLGAGKRGNGGHSHLAQPYAVGKDLDTYDPEKFIYFMAPWNSSPKEYAGHIVAANNLPDEVANFITTANKKLARKLCDSRLTVDGHIAFANGKSAGILCKNKKTEPDEQLMLDCAEAIKYFTGE